MPATSTGLSAYQVALQTIDCNITASLWNLSQTCKDRSTTNRTNRHAQQTLTRRLGKHQARCAWLQVLRKTKRLRSCHTRCALHERTKVMRERFIPRARPPQFLLRCEGHMHHMDAPYGGAIPQQSVPHSGKHNVKRIAVSDPCALCVVAAVPTSNTGCASLDERTRFRGQPLTSSPWCFDHLRHSSRRHEQGLHLRGLALAAERCCPPGWRVSSRGDGFGSGASWQGLAL